MRETLHKNNASIILPSLQTLSILQINDKSLMDYAMTLNLPMSKIHQINNCRLFLQITTLAEVCTGEGTQLLQEGLYGHVNISNTPKLWDISTSKLIWPYQEKPLPAVWKAWKHFLQTLIKPGTSNILKHSLGPWIPSCHQHRNWKYCLHLNIIISYTNNNIQLTSNNNNHPQENTSRSEHIHLENTTKQLLDFTRALPLTPTKIDGNNIKIKRRRTTQYYMTYQQLQPQWLKIISNKYNPTTSIPILKLIKSAKIYINYVTKQGYKNYYAWSISDEVETLYEVSGKTPETSGKSLLQSNTQCIIAALASYITILQTVQCPIPPRFVTINIKCNELFTKYQKIKNTKIVNPQQYLQNEDYDYINTLFTMSKLFKQLELTPPVAQPTNNNDNLQQLLQKEQVTKQQKTNKRYEVEINPYSIANYK